MITEENTIGIGIDKKTMNEFLRGKRNSISIDLHDDNASNFVEYMEGDYSGYILNVEEMPIKYHGCYFYNNGVFPYIIKKDLENIMLVESDTRIVGKIVSCTPKAGQRFRFGENPGDPSIDDPKMETAAFGISLLS